MFIMRSCKYALSCALVFCQQLSADAQTISETSRSIKTYPFSDANPIPSMGVNNNIGRFYPYFMFDGYTNIPSQQKWKVITLENKLVSVEVLPQVGGKVYGAIDKTSGNEFVYLNKVMKFRAIGSRGPWTSGGIEHNFGLDIGHAPWAASAVDYIIRKRDDGSMECVVGGLDLASRTQWRVTIALPPNSAYFETKALLYNPTAFHHAYLSWENAAFKASNDLEFFFPGNYHIDHDGSARPWPIDEKGRDLSKYNNNNFGTSKSYHVMGSTRNWFGGIWQKGKVGFGHWAPYTDAPGKKLWIWSLARDGAIWEDLLTDEDGQYIEAQSGVKFNQADVVSGYHSPFKQLYLRPGYTETKYETWFPVKDIDTIADANSTGSLAVKRNNDSLYIAISPNTTLTDSLYVFENEKIILASSISLIPLQVYKQHVRINTNTRNIVVKTVRGKLEFRTQPEFISRPVVSPEDYLPTDAQRLFLLAEDKNSMRLHDEAMEIYKSCLAKEPSHTGALARIAELMYRGMNDDSALAYVHKALSINTYDAAANYLAGIIEKRRGNINDAEESFSVATRTFEFRADAYRQLAEIAMGRNDFPAAELFSRKALQYNSNNISAHQILCVALRKSGNLDAAERQRKLLLDIDPLNHFARFESYMQNKTDAALAEFRLPIQNEFPHESYLELGVTYYGLMQREEAIAVLQLSPAHPMVSYWLAFLQGDKNLINTANQQRADFVFPFREESVPVLQYAIASSESWKPKYYLALIYWSKGDRQKAYQLMQDCKSTPDFAPFYISRAKLNTSKTAEQNKESDLRKANTLAPGEWRTYYYLAEHLSTTGRNTEAEDTWTKAIKFFPKNPVVSVGYAKTLLDNKKFKQCLDILEKVYVLPQEHANQGHAIYENAHIAMSLEHIRRKKWNDAITSLNKAKKWPENLGSGEPYEPDNRLANLLLMYCEKQKGNNQKAALLSKSIVEFTLDTWPRSQKPLATYIGIAELRASGEDVKLQTMMNTWKQQTDSLLKWGLPGGAGGILRDYVIKKAENDPASDELENRIYAKENDLNVRLFIEAIRLVYGNK